MKSVEMFFDCSSPWTYLAFEGLGRMADEFGVAVDWRLILVGGIFNTVNPSVYRNRDDPVPAKQAYQGKDLADWARHAGLPIVWPPTVFPVNSVKAMRGCLVAADEGCLVEHARAVFEAYWGADEDISQETVLGDICARIGLDTEAYLAGIAEPEIKQRLKANTEEVVRRGGFGTPTIFIDGDDMYFGQDRLPLVRDALAAR